STSTTTTTTTTTTSPPKPDTTTIGSVKPKGKAILVRMLCQGTSPRGCIELVTLSVVETLRSGKVIAVSATKRRHRTAHKTVVIGTAAVTIAAGQAKLVGVSLNARGRALLSRRHTLHARLTVIQIVGTTRLTVKAVRVTLTEPTHRRR
ncbi:MAG TPA: hypothetical protein VG223_18675, partial [Solirubrobacteraceae bacterium]|nr:hypothetical protein [Solirubrobacteraceae bacterium]